MRNLMRSNSGFTFVESLITFSIVGIFLALTWATVNFMLVKSTEQIVRTRGHFLAMEGVERIKQIRQTAINRNREFGFYEAIGSKSGAYILGESGEEFTLFPGMNEEIEMNEEPYTTYCRTATFEGDLPDEKVANVEVRWGDVVNCSAGEKMVAYSTYLADLTQ